MRFVKKNFRAVFVPRGAPTEGHTELVEFEEFEGVGPPLTAVEHAQSMGLQRVFALYSEGGLAAGER